MVSLGHVSLFLVSKCSDWIHVTNLGLAPHVHPLKGFDEGTVQSLKSQDLWRTNSKGYRMSGKVYQTHLKVFFLFITFVFAPKITKICKFWRKMPFSHFFCRFALKQSQVCFFFSSNMKFPVSFGSQTISNAIPWKKNFFKFSV